MSPCFEPLKTLMRPWVHAPIGTVSPLSARLLQPTPPTTRLQVVQRSLSGGFLTEDALLLNANARSMFDEAGHHVLGGPPLTRALRRRAALRSQ